ncbi:RecX family transcriptional regulator [Vibrio parahaemolyticus]|nr:RecX family transcriptional regulator [Vibrio parahaemolyticus]
MPNFSDEQIQTRITHILNQKPQASTMYVKQRLVCLGVTSKCLYLALLPFYEQRLIDDHRHIEQFVQIALQKRQGFNLIARLLAQSRFNHVQIAEALLVLSNKMDHRRQAYLCMKERFGKEKVIDPDLQSDMLIYLQKQGHRLTDIWEVMGMRRTRETLSDTNMR